MAATGTHGFCHSPPSFLRPVMLRNLFKAWLKGRSESLVAFDQYVERMFAGGDRFVCTLGYSWCIYVCNPCISMHMTTHIAYILRWLHRSISSYCKCISWKTSWQNFICSIKDELHCPSLPMSRESGSTGGILLTARCMKPQILWTSIVTWSLAGLGQDSEALGNKLRFTSGVLLRHLMRFRGFIVRVHVVPCHYPPGDDGLPADRCGWWALSSYIYGFPSRPLDVPLVLTKWLLFWEINLSCSYSKMCRGCFHGVGLRHADKKKTVVCFVLLRFKSAPRLCKVTGLQCSCSSNIYWFWLFHGASAASGSLVVFSANDQWLFFLGGLLGWSWDTNLAPIHTNFAPKIVVYMCCKNV